MADQKNEKRKTKNEKLEKLVNKIEGLTVLELSEFVALLQEKLGVSPIAPTAPSPAAQQAAPEESGTQEGEQKTGGVANQTVVLAQTGENKIAVIKALRAINPNLGLKEAKDITESTPKDILENVKAEEAQAAKKKLEAAGATVELK